MSGTPVIHVSIVRHEDQRYPTVGDWRMNDQGEWLISISDLGDWRMNLLVAVHELIEQALCVHRGVAEEAVTAFDVHFEASRVPGDESEPGDDRRAPYHTEHQFATYIERRLSAELDVDWHQYEAAISAAGEVKQ